MNSSAINILICTDFPLRYFPGGELNYDLYWSSVMWGRVEGHRELKATGRVQLIPPCPSPSAQLPLLALLVPTTSSMNDPWSSFPSNNPRCVLLLYSHQQHSGLEQLSVSSQGFLGCAGWCLLGSTPAIVVIWRLDWVRAKMAPDTTISWELNRTVSLTLPTFGGVSMWPDFLQHGN